MIEMIVDTREQKPWQFPSDEFNVVRRGLIAGDYSIAGMENKVAIERKSIGDLVNTVIGQWLRFRKELNRLSGYEFAAIVVEADVSDLMEHRYESEADPASVWGRCNACFVDHGIPVLWWGSRQYCEPAAARFFKLIARKFACEISTSSTTPLNVSATKPT